MNFLAFQWSHQVFLWQRKLPKECTRTLSVPLTEAKQLSSPTRIIKCQQKTKQPTVAIGKPSVPCQSFSHRDLSLGLLGLQSVKSLTCIRLHGVSNQIYIWEIVSSIRFMIKSLRSEQERAGGLPVSRCLSKQTSQAPSPNHLNSFKVQVRFSCFRPSI